MLRGRLAASLPIQLPYRSDGNWCHAKLARFREANNWTGKLQSNVVLKFDRLEPVKCRFPGTLRKAGDGVLPYYPGAETKSMGYVP